MQRNKANKIILIHTRKQVNLLYICLMIGKAQGANVFILLALSEAASQRMSSEAQLVRFRSHRRWWL